VKEGCFGSGICLRYRGGTTTPLTSDTALWNVYPVTAGHNTVYRKQEPCCGTQRYGLFLHDDATEIERSPLVAQNNWFGPMPGPDYQVNGGWAAFTRRGTGGQWQVWTRSPAGTLTQITFWGDSSRVSALAPNGEVMFLHGRRYLNVPGQQPLEINSGVGNAFWQDGHWWLTLGRSLFKVNTGTFPTVSGLFTTRRPCSPAGYVAFRGRALRRVSPVAEGFRVNARHCPTAIPAVCCNCVRHDEVLR